MFVCHVLRGRDRRRNQDFVSGMFIGVEAVRPKRLRWWWGDSCGGSLSLLPTS